MKHFWDLKGNDCGFDIHSVVVLQGIPFSSALLFLGHLLLLLLISHGEFYNLIWFQLRHVNFAIFANRHCMGILKALFDVSEDTI